MTNILAALYSLVTDRVRHTLHAPIDKRLHIVGGQNWPVLSLLLKLSATISRLSYPLLIFGDFI